MKVSTSVADRMREMLTRDKVGFTDGFAAAMKGDITHALQDLSLIHISQPTRRS